MNFELSEDHRLLLETIQDVVKGEIQPRAKDNDLKHEIAPEIIKTLSELGFMGSYVPENYQGSDLDFLSYCLIVEEVSKACASTGVMISAHTSLCCNPILQYGSEAQKQKFLPDLCQGKKIGAFLLTEAEAGSDVANQQTKYTDEGDHYLVNGSKIFISNGGFLGTGILFATTDTSLKHKGISAFIVDLKAEGITLIKNEEKLGIRGSYTSAFGIDGLKIPKDQLLGTEGEGFAIAMDTLNGGRIGIASQALGIAEGAMAEAVKYVEERKQFDKPISRFQAIQFKLADMQIRIEASRLLTYKAAWLKMQKKDYNMESAMAKAHASETANFVANEALQIHGGYGYINELPLERFYRDAKITEIYEGTNEVQRIVIAKEILK